MAQELFLPVSIGEGLDKLTILDIKMDKIKDDRRADCQKEYAALFEKLETYVKRFPWHYAILKDINLHLWNLQDEFHGKDVDEITLGKICSKVLLENGYMAICLVLKVPNLMEPIKELLMLIDIFLSRYTIFA